MKRSHMTSAFSLKAILLTLFLTLPPIGIDRAESYSIGQPPDDTVREETAYALSNAVSSVPKLFWFDCGPEDDCTKASIYYVDPAAATPSKTLFDSNVVVLSENIMDGHAFTSGSVDLSTSKMTNLKVAFIVYFKDGKIWKVNTTTLEKTQVSSESGITAWPYICDAAALVNWNNIANSIFYYVIGTGACNIGNEPRKMTRLGMDATTPPIDTKLKGQPLAIMFDGRVLVKYGHDYKLCNANLSTCKPLLTDVTYLYSNYLAYDTKYILFWADYILYSYDYTKNVLTSLISPIYSEDIMNGIIDRDGYAYYSVRDGSGFSYTIRRIALTGGAATTLASFTTSALISGLRIESSPSRIIYSYQDPSSKLRAAYSVAKNGGTPVLLSNACVRGFVAGDYFIFENSAGSLAKVKVDGTGRVARPDTQLIGASQGASGDWYYRYDPARLRIITKDSDNTARSFLLSDNIATAAGVVMGTVPVNLGGIFGTGFRYDMLIEGQKYETETSFGNDIIYVNAGSAASFKRLTNSNGTKGLLDFQDLLISQTIGKPLN